MASSGRLSLTLFIVLSILVHGSLAEITCENLPTEMCAYAVSGSGRRCVLEKIEGKLECKSSVVMVDRLANYIENDRCISDCGLGRHVVGISSDSLLEVTFTQGLCSSACYENCPNVVDLYFNLAAAEGVYLPRLCEVQRTNPRRAMLDLISNGEVAPAPVAGGHSAEVTSESPVGAPLPL